MDEAVQHQTQVKKPTGAGVDEGAKGGADMRVAPRFTLLIRAAKVVSAHGEFVGVIRDVSETGISIRFFHQVPSGDPIELHMPSGAVYPIHPKWSRDKEAGFAFAQTVDVQGLINTSDDFPPRPMRLALMFPIRVRTLSAKTEAVIENLSQQGARFECGERFAIDQTVYIDCEEAGVRLKDVRAKIRWRRGNHYGVVFDDTFSLSDFARFAGLLQCPSLLD